MLDNRIASPQGELSPDQVDISGLVDTSRVIEIERVDPSVVRGRLGYRFAKRAFDIVAGSAALVVCAVPMAVIAVLVKRDSAGPVFYRQERVGLNGKPFNLVKFRTMYEDAEVNGPQWAEAVDGRVTRIGGVLRKTRLDEIPQFAQVVTGKLSLVGPRPERPVFTEAFERYIHGFSQRVMVRPGISGLAQVMGGYDLKPAEKVVYDVEYIKQRSVTLDLIIMGKTMMVVFTGDGAR